MMHITRILCPVDFSEFSARALRRAAGLAAHYEASLTALHVVPAMAIMDVPVPLLTTDQQDGLLTDLERFVARVVPEAEATCIVGEAPDVARDIASQAQALEASLLVIGSHGRSGISRFLLGSIAEKVLRQAPCPTLVVPHSAATPGGSGHGPFARILCPIDFSPGSHSVASYAMTMAEEADATISLLTVLEIPVELNEFPVSAGIDFQALRATARARAEEQLRAQIPPDAENYCTVDTVVREGVPDRVILAVAAERQSDLIVMGVHGRGTIDRMIFGSTVARVTRQASCPVLVVRPITAPFAETNAGMAS